MGLTNAERQQRWRERNVVVLTADARDIAGTLIDMADQSKLKKVARFVNDHLRHPDRSLEERQIALGYMGINSLDGPLSKTAAIKQIRAGGPPPDCWRIEAIGGGKRWSSGVRLSSRAEAEVYGEFYARHEVKGFERFEVVHCPNEQNNCSIFRRRRGGRPTLTFPDGSCVLLGWTPIIRKKSRRPNR